MKYIIIILSLFVVGCKCFQCDEPSYQGPLEFKPLPPEKLHKLLYEKSNEHWACSGCAECKKMLWAYKSVTKKDYETKDFN